MILPKAKNLSVVISWDLGRSIKSKVFYEKATILKNETKKFRFLSVGKKKLFLYFKEPVLLVTWSVK